MTAVSRTTPRLYEQPASPATDERDHDAVERLIPARATTQRGLRSILRNAISNVLRGGTTAAISVTLPHFLSRSLDPQRFASWALLLQIAAYASFLDFGLQVAVSRFVAQATEMRQWRERVAILRASLTLLAFAAALAFLAASVVVWKAPLLFAGVPAGMLREFRIAALIFAAGSGLQLILGTYAGALAGMHRNDLAALPMTFAKLAGAVAVVILAKAHGSLVILACVMMAGPLVGSLLQASLAQKLIGDARIFLPAYSAASIGKLLRFSRSLGVWSFGTLLVSGLDLTILGHYRFASVAPYAIAASVTALIAGLDNAMLSSLMAPLAALHAMGSNARIGELSRQATAINSTANLVFLLLAALVGPAALRLWVGPQYGASAQPLLLVLALAQFVRLTASPYSVALIACGLHAKGIPAALAEAVVNFTFSIWLVQRYGAIGVALGTLIGSIISLMMHFVYTMPRTPEVQFSRMQLVRAGLVSPMVWLSPVVCYALWTVRSLFPGTR